MLPSGPRSSLCFQVHWTAAARSTRAAPIMIERPWIAHYDDGVPPSLAYPPGTLVDVLRATGAERPGHPAVLFKGAALTYGDLDRLSTAFAAALAADGVRPGDRVGLLLPNCPQFIVAQFGIWKAGAIVVALNPTYTERELELPLRETGVEVLVALTRFYARVKAVQPRTPVRRVIATNIKEYLPRLTSLLFTVFRERKEGHRITLARGDAWFTGVIAAGTGQRAPTVTVSADDRAVILASGGTTGTPKGVVGMHRAYIQAGLQLREWTKALCAPWVDRIMLPLPLFHVYANVGVQAMAFMGHNPLALVANPRDIDDVLATIGKVRPTFFAGVPTLFTALLNHPDVREGRADFSSIRICFSGAAALMAETRRRFEDLTGGRIIEGYSLTEGMMACMVNPVLGTAKTGSIGMPLPDVDLLVVDADDPSIVLDANLVGEILIRAPQLMEGYWCNPRETALVLRPRPEGGTWLHTGDLGYLDEDGYVFIVDRKKDLIKTSGYQVWPREIEEVLAAHPAVLEVGVAGVPHDSKGEVVKAWVVLRPGGSAPPDVDELRAWCRDRLAPYKVPAIVEFRDELPKSMVGKVLRRMLAQAPLPAD
jgi:long-chain acyl-CoA synthetase